MEEKFSMRERILWRLSAYARRMSQWTERRAGILTPEQIRRVRDFWAPYGKVNPIFHAYFTEKTGIFDRGH